MDLFISHTSKYCQSPQGTSATQFASALFQHTAIHISSSFTGKGFLQEQRNKKVFFFFFFADYHINSYVFSKVRDWCKKKIKQKAKNLFPIMPVFIVSHFSAVIKTRYDMGNQCPLMDWVRIQLLATEPALKIIVLTFKTISSFLLFWLGRTRKKSYSRF